MKVATLEPWQKDFEHRSKQFRELWVQERRREQPNGNWPSHLYKLMAPERFHWIWQVCVANRLFLSSVDLFNDPFDSEVEFECDFEHPNFKILTEKMVEDENARRRVSGAPQAAWEQHFSNKKSAEARFRNALREVRDRIGIACLTAENSSSVMWGHYASKHQGIAIEFDFEVLRRHCEPLPVCYSSERYTLRYPEADLDFAFFGALTKDVGWSYEREWRILRHWGAGSWARFPLHAITGIYFGMRANNTFIADVCEMLTSQKRLYAREAIRFYKGQPSPKKLHVEFKEIERRTSVRSTIYSGSVPSPRIVNNRR